MREDILEIRDSLEAGQFVNEAAVSQGIVQRVLHLLGWPVYNTGVVSPEYSLDGRRVDYALCHPPKSPLVLIEVKQVGQSEGADRQLFEYAFHEGVPMAILTDGKEWSFFLPTEQGRYEERRLYKLDILERDPEETEATLNRYLKYEGICSGQAIEDARRDYRNAARKRQAQKALPEAWSRLIESEDDLLIDLVSEKVEDLCGIKPEPGSVAAFLRERLRMVDGGPTIVKPEQLPPHRKSAPPEKPSPTTQRAIDGIGYTLYGQTYQEQSATAVLVSVFRALAERDAGFLERFAMLPPSPRQKRTYVARTREELYPGRPDLALNQGRKLRPGWWIDTHQDREMKKTER